MKKLIALLILMVVGFSNLSAQEQEQTQEQEWAQPDSLSAEEIKLVGVWKVDLPEQKSKQDSESKAQVDKMDSRKKEDFWKATESRVYVLDSYRNFVMTWVADGSHNEVRGVWKLDAQTGILGLYSENELVEFQVEFKEKGQIWIPVTKSKEGFSILYIKGLGL